MPGLGCTRARTSGVASPPSIDFGRNNRGIDSVTGNPKTAASRGMLYGLAAHATCLARTPAHAQRAASAGSQGWSFPDFVTNRGPDRCTTHPQYCDIPTFGFRSTCGGPTRASVIVKHRDIGLSPDRALCYSTVQLSKPRRSCGRFRLRPMNTSRLKRFSPSFQGPMKSPSAIMCTAWKAKRRFSFA